MTVKLYISQPMSDKTDEEIKAEREALVNRVTDFLGNDDVEIIDSFFEGAPHDVNPLWYLGQALQLLSTADAVAFAPDWQDYRGCRIEHQCAIEYSIPLVFVE